MWQSVSGVGKKVDPCVNDRQSLTVCHVRIVVKNCEIVCGGLDGGGREGSRVGRKLANSTLISS